MNDTGSRKAPFAKKSLGQNFLVDKAAIARIAAAVPMGTLLLLEIGPGRGALSTELFPHADKFCVLEKDDLFARNIGETLFVHGSRSHYVFHADALEFSWDRLWTESGSSVDTPLSICANLPYNVATEIFFRLLAMRDRIPLMVLMFQKEVAQRIAARPGTRESGILSVAAQNFYDVRVQQILKPAAFRPSPKVDSAVLELRRLDQPVLPFGIEEFPRFLDLVRACFAHRRKTLENSLSLEAGKIGWTAGRDALKARLVSLGIQGQRRAETLSILEFGKLYQGLRA
jgi:16S rRNA (adenine1518-N6/adenine1519-N6)-dimethyltransferase